MSKPYDSPCYCTNMRRCAGMLSELYDSQLRGSGLTVPQYYLLINLRRLGSANITRWAERVGLERSTMVRNVRLLRERGLIEEAEGRGKTFTLSEAGESALDSAIPMWESAQSRVEELLGPEDAASILRIGRKLGSLHRAVKGY